MWILWQLYKPNCTTVGHSSGSLTTLNDGCGLISDDCYWLGAPYVTYLVAFLPLPGCGLQKKTCLKRVLTRKNNNLVHCTHSKSFRDLVKKFEKGHKQLNGYFEK